MSEKFRVTRVFEVVHAVHNAEEVTEKYSRLLGISFDLQWELPWENMRVRAAQIGETQLHVVEATAAAGPIDSFLKKKGEGIHHICFEVKGLDALIEHLRSQGVKLIPDKPVRVGDVAYIFIHPSSMNGVLIELVEKG